MAGVLPYTIINPYTGHYEGDVWVMISKEKGGPNPGTWDAFSGKVDPGETIEQAAAREGAEESCEMFGKADKIAKRMFPMGHSKSTFLLNAEDVRSKEEIIHKCSAKAYLERKKWTKYQKGKFQEKTAVKWVKLSRLIDACVNQKGVLRKDGHKDMVIRPYFYKSIAKHKAFLQELTCATKAAHFPKIKK